MCNIQKKWIANCCWLPQIYSTSLQVTVKIVAIFILCCILLLLMCRHTKNSVISTIYASLWSKASEKTQIPLKQTSWHDIRQLGTFFLVKLLKLKKLWHKNIIRNNVTKNYEDLTIFGAVTPQLVHFLVPIYFSKFSVVNFWTALTFPILKLQKSCAYFWIHKSIL